MVFADVDQMISNAEVKLTEYCRPLKFKGGGYEWQGIMVLNGDVVEASVVTAGSEGLILLINKKEASTSRE